MWVIKDTLHHSDLFQQVRHITFGFKACVLLVAEFWKIRRIMNCLSVSLKCKEAELKAVITLKFPSNVKDKNDGVCLY